jgi:ABC-type arginine transport system permease subunit
MGNDLDLLAFIFGVFIVGFILGSFFTQMTLAAGGIP